MRGKNGHCALPLPIGQCPDKKGLKILGSLSGANLSFFAAVNKNSGDGAGVGGSQRGGARPPSDALRAGSQCPFARARDLESRP